MCVSAAGVSAGLSILGAGAKAIGSISSGNAGAASSQYQAQMAMYQAQVARNNQIIANQQADTEIATGEVQAANQSLVGAAQQGGLKAKQGASGVDVNTGSSVDVQASERQLRQLDTETVLANAQRRAYGYRAQASTFGAQAGLDTSQSGMLQQQAGYSTESGYLKAGGSLLSAASSLPFKWNSGSGSGIDAEIANWSNYGVPGATTY